jgi:hypothetical protein
MESSKKVTPFDLFKKSNYAEKEIINNRISLCYSCEELIKITTQCKKCGCFMELKTKLKDAGCPLGKW